MKILFCSVPFRPSMGGIETVSAILAEQFQRLGHSVTLVTQTPSTETPIEPYTVVRRPRPSRLWRLVREADVVFHNNISLRLAWPLLALRRPWVVAHHTWITRRDPAGRLKRGVLRFARNISVRRAVANDLPVPSVVVPNPYRSAMFRPIDGVARTKDIAFLGRLVSDKGVGVLLDALHLVKARGLMVNATVIGDGPEEMALRAQAARLGLGNQVEFAGTLSGEALARRLHEHHLLVVPSVWEEPFGVVVLEALACGCVPVVSCSGGLPEAAGPAGRVFAKGDATALAEAIVSLRSDGVPASCRTAPAEDHLARHHPEQVAAAYIRVFKDACRRHRVATPA
jgi:glycogen synthase